MSQQPPPPPSGPEDQPPGPGYWKASDGNWYPPESRPLYPPQAAQPQRAPQAGYPPAYGAPAIDNFLVPAIISIFCCTPFGIVAIIQASSVNTKLAAGDIAGAQQAAKNARTWTFVAFGVGAAVAVVYILLMVIAAGSSEY
jgi:hypothetical protein